MSNTRLRTLLCLGLALLGFARLNAQSVVLTIDWSNLSAVKFTASGTAPDNPYDGSTAPSMLKFNDGIALLGFFPSNVTTQDIGSLVSSDLSDSGNTAFFDILSSWNDGVPNSSPGQDLTLWSDPGANFLFFDTGSQAFNGEAVFDLSGYSTFTNLFPALNTTGNVVVWNGTETLGTWKVVGASAIPEPSTYATVFGVVALVGTVALRRRQRFQS